MQAKTNQCEDIFTTIMRAKSDPTVQITFRAYAEMWLRAYKAPPKTRESSYAVIKNTLYNHVISFFGDIPLDQVTPMHIQMFLNSIADMSKSVQNKSLQYTKAIFSTAIDNGLLSRSPITSTDKVAAEAPEQEEPLTNDQAKRLLAAVKGTRAYLFILIGLTTGMRRGEILGLMWEDIDMEKRVITVTHNKAFRIDNNEAKVTKLLKTEAAHRRLPISEPLYKELLAEKKKAESPYVIHMGNGDSLSKGSFNAMWKTVTAKMVEPGKNRKNRVLDFYVHPHMLRKYYCTTLIESGADIKAVQYLMGHSKPDITMAVYAQYRQKEREAETNAKVCQVMGNLC